MARRLLSLRVLFSVENITIRGKNIPDAIYDFDKTGFPEAIVENLKLKYAKPSVIQAISWPIALSGRDMISVAKTGSGKTLAFMLPGIVHSLKVPRRPPGSGPTTLVLAPTRELAQQVNSVSLQYSQIVRRSSACLFGGSSRVNQEVILRQGIDVCVATPGRLLDFLASGVTDLNRCSYLVLDEADRMLDMGFEPQIRSIIEYVKSECQTLMFTATWPDSVQNLAADFQKNPVFVNIGSLELAANHNIEQIVEVINEEEKPKHITNLLQSLLKDKDAKILIFVETKSKADGLARAMMRIGWKVGCIHGDKSQLQRETTLKSYIPILLATDIAARGLDVQDIKTVINYDFPAVTENYVHRIGRTGRQDKKGTAYTFFTREDSVKASDLIKILREANQEVPKELEKLVGMSSMFKNRTRDGLRHQRSQSGSNYSRWDKSFLAKNYEKGRTYRKQNYY